MLDGEDGVDGATTSPVPGAASMDSPHPGHWVAPSGISALHLGQVFPRSTVGGLKHIDTFPF